MKETILWSLAFLGLGSLIKWGWTLIKGESTVRPNTSLILVVYNWEENIERLIRFIATQCYFNQTLFCPVDVIVIDIGSTDHTFKILQKLARQFSFLKVLDGQYLKKSQYSMLDYAKERCQGEVVLLIDTTVLNLGDVQKVVKFYFNENAASSKVLENTGDNGGK